MGDEEAWGTFWWLDLLEEEDTVECSQCGKQIPEDEVINCQQCGAPLCLDCELNGMCPTCAELREAEIDLADLEAEED